MLQNLAARGFFEAIASIVELKVAISGVDDLGTAQFAWMPAAASKLGLHTAKASSQAPEHITMVGAARATLLKRKALLPDELKVTLGKKDGTLFQDEVEVQDEVEGVSSDAPHNDAASFVRPV